MADINTPMTPGDHVLVNAALCIVLTTLHPSDDQAMLRDILQRALVKSAGDNPTIVRLRDVAQQYLNATRRDLVAEFELKQALLNWARWRLGRAQAQELAA